MTLKAHETLIAWTPASPAWADHPNAGQVKVGPLLRKLNAPDWTKPYAYTGGAAYAARRDLRGARSVAALFIDFHALVVRDGIPPAVVHEAFLAIEEYAESIAPDTAGAREPVE